MQYVIELNIANIGWVVLTPTTNARKRIATHPYRFSSEEFALDFLRKFYRRNLQNNTVRVIRRY